MNASDAVQFVSYPFVALVAAVVLPIVILVLGLAQQDVKIEFRAWPLKIRVEVDDGN